jgi:hypothetical protein
MRPATLLIISVLLSLPATAYESSENTLALSNGRAWQRMSATQRLGYLSGLFDGLNYYGPHIEFRTDRASVGFNGPEIAAGVTNFYAADPSRLQLPIPVAVTLFFRHAEGDSDERIRQRVQELLRETESAKARARPIQP